MNFPKNCSIHWKWIEARDRSAEGGPYQWRKRRARERCPLGNNREQDPDHELVLWNGQQYGSDRRQMPFHCG